MVAVDRAGAIVEALVTAFNQADRHAVAALLHDEVVVQGMPMEPARGRAAAMAMLEPFLAADAVDWRIETMVAHERVVFAERVDRFRFSGGNWTQVRATGVFELADDGRILAWRDYFDMAELTAAMS